MARVHLIFCGTILALSACASAPTPVQEPVHPHQSANDPNPQALPTGVLEWVTYACAIEDPAERAKALQQGTERGWIFTCPKVRT